MSKKQVLQVEWVTLKRLSELTGLTSEAIRAMIKKGKLQIDYHWHKQDGRIYLNIERFNEWAQGKTPRNIRA
ncbi:MAG: hypothetical protein V7721_00855 [Porticoccaceae bacterium]